MAEENAQRLRIELLSTEAVKTSAIEGEVLDRDSVRSSVRRQFGLQTDHQRVSEKEAGIAELMVSLYRSFNKPLTHNMLHDWHPVLAHVVEMTCGDVIPGLGGLWKICWGAKRNHQGIDNNLINPRPGTVIPVGDLQAVESQAEIVRTGRLGDMLNFYQKKAT